MSKLTPGIVPGESSARYDILSAKAMEEKEEAEMKMCTDFSTSFQQIYLCLQMEERM